MKRLNITLVIVMVFGLFLVSCDDLQGDLDDALQQIEELENQIQELQEEEEVPENILPVIELLPGSQLIENGASVTFSVTIDDQDDFYHSYCWTLDGESCGDSDEYTFSDSPEFETSYIISVAISDGTDIVSASSKITVKQMPWQPEPLHIYFFEIGSHESEETAVKTYVASDNDEYDYFAIASITTLEMYNRDNDPDAYRVMGGYE